MEWKVFIYTVLLLVIVTAVSFASVKHSWKEQKWPPEIYYFNAFCLLIFCIIYGIAFLDYDIAGSGVSIKRTRTQIMTTRDEIISISTQTLEINDLILQCTGYGGCSETQKKAIITKSNELKKYIDMLKPVDK